MNMYNIPDPVLGIQDKKRKKLILAFKRIIMK